jgi:class 3 adenylate cyclase
MPMFMDIHPDLGDATPEDVARAHQRDLEVQDKYGVKFLTYWLNDPEGKSFCLVEAPDAESAKACHKESHGLMPNEIIEVDPPTLGQFLGTIATDDGDRAVIEGTNGQLDTALRVIMFTDIVGSTDISTTRGDDAAMEAVSSHDSIVRGALAQHGGREVKHTGDGILASFTSVTGALDAALTVQESAETDDSPAIKIGMSAGEPVEQSRDIYGASVNLAARICAHAAGGQTLVAATVRDLAVGKHVAFRDAGPIALKGFTEPIQLYEIVGRD